jgi:hypothetical protein
MRIAWLHDGGGGHGLHVPEESSFLPGGVGRGAYPAPAGPATVNAMASGPKGLAACCAQSAATTGLSDAGTRNRDPGGRA